ncbi:MAG: NrfD/PsrC family molybdoenzyme membrane anchor subunit, partial [Nitrososphaerota archaeon]
WTTSSTLGRAIWSASIVASFLVMVYDGFLLNSGRSISAWNSSLIPLIFVIYSLGGGVALTSITFLSSGATPSAEVIGYLDTLLLLAILACIGVYLISLTSLGKTARESIRLLVRGRVAPFFLIGAVIAGIVIPLILLYITHSPESSRALSMLMVATAMLELAGDLSFRHSILRVGLHIPLI